MTLCIYRTTITVICFLRPIHQEVIMTAEEEVPLMVTREILMQMEAIELRVEITHLMATEILVS